VLQCFVPQLAHPAPDEVEVNFVPLLTAQTDIRLLTSVDEHFGQDTAALLDITSSSNSLPQPPQVNSNIGIFYLFTQEPSPLWIHQPAEAWPCQLSAKSRSIWGTVSAPKLLAVAISL
jgi:hypothetical protein